MEYSITRSSRHDTGPRHLHRELLRIRVNTLVISQEEDCMRPFQVLGIDVIEMPVTERGKRQLYFQCQTRGHPESPSSLEKRLSHLSVCQSLYCQIEELTFSVQH